MSSAFLLEHAYRDNDDTDQRVRIGIYSSETEARDAVARLRSQPGFRDYPDNFVIHPYEIDKSYWTQGYDNSDEI